MPSEWLETVIVTILRTPGLVMLEYWHQTWWEDLLPTPMSLISFFLILKSLACLMSALSLMLLPLTALVRVYMYVLSFFAVLLAEVICRVYVEEQLHYSSFLYPIDNTRHMTTFACYVALSAVTSWCLNLRHPLMKWLLVVYAFPMVASVAYTSDVPPADILPIARKVSSTIVIIGCVFYHIKIIPDIFNFLRENFYVYRVLVHIYGYFQAVVIVLTRLVDPSVFLLFWVSLLLNQAWQEYFALTERGFMVASNVKLLLVMSEVCRSPLTLIASCLSVMLICHAIIRAVILYLESCKSHAPPSEAVQSGCTEGVVMFLLSLQTGLIDMEMPQRLGAMSVVLFVVAASLFQTVLEVTHPVLLALSAASSKNPFSHIKSILLCAVIVCVPAYTSYLLVETVDLDLWTMVFISSSLLTSVQAIGHFIHYCLYLYDSIRSEPLESLDDVIFYLKSVIHCMELISALFVVGAGLNEAFEGHWSLLNSIVLCVHCYFNVWLRIKSGWKSFLMRQAAVVRVQTLNDATDAQLKAHADICAICYCEMAQNAKITPCGHFFHGGCLKKWLYVQDHCPMCSAKVVEEQQKVEQVADPAQEAELVEDVINFDQQHDNDLVW